MINDHIHFGGGGDAAFQLERRILEEHGHEVHTFSVASGEAGYSSDRDVVYREPTSQLACKLGKFLWNPVIQKELKGLVFDIKPDLVKLHLVSKYPADIYAALIGHRVTQMLHGPNLFCATGWGVLKANGAECEQGIGLKCYQRGCVTAAQLPLHLNLSRRNAVLAPSVLTRFYSPSRQLARTAEALGFAPVEYFPLALDPGFYGVTPQFSENKEILYVGSLVEQKGVLYLLQAMKRILDVHPDATLKIVGRGALREVLERFVTSNGLGHAVQFLGFQSRGEVLELYQAADVMVVPSIWREQFGLVGAEALACGVPCVGSNTGGIPEWLHDGKSGLLTTPRDSHSIAEAVITLLDDQAMRRSYGTYGRETVLREYSYEQYESNVLKQLADV